MPDVKSSSRHDGRARLQARLICRCVILCGTPFALSNTQCYELRAHEFFSSVRVLGEHRFQHGMKTRDDLSLDLAFWAAHALTSELARVRRPLLAAAPVWKGLDIDGLMQLLPLLRKTLPGRISALPARKGHAIGN